MEQAQFVYVVKQILNAYSADNFILNAKADIFMSDLQVWNVKIFNQVVLKYKQKSNLKIKEYNYTCNDVINKTTKHW